MSEHQIRELTPDEMVGDLLADIQLKLDTIPELTGDMICDIMDAITPTIEARDIRERPYRPSSRVGQQPASDLD